MFQLQLSPGNWSDVTSFLATNSQPESDGVSTTVSDIFEHINATTETMAMVPNLTNNGRNISNRSLYEKNTLSQQDQCWETYVGQVGIWMSSCRVLVRSSVMSQHLTFSQTKI